ncbi:MAG: ATP-binding protein [Lachnospirales bacterium]
MNTIIGKTATKKLKHLFSNFNGLVYITGISGSGKSYLTLLIILQTLLKNYSVIIFDFGNSYTKTQIPSQIFQQIEKYLQIYNIRTDGIPTNTFNPMEIIDEEGKYIETEKHIATRVTDMVERSLPLGVQQKSVLYTAIKDCINYVEKNIVPDYFNHPNNIFLALKITSVNWDSIIVILQMMANSDEKCTKSAGTLYTKLFPIIDNLKFSDDLDWSEIITSTPKLTVFNMKGLSRSEVKLTTNMMLEDLYSYITSRDNEVPFLSILDEFQICGFKFDEGSPLHTLLTQGRKYNFNAIMATQHPIKALEPELNQASTRIIMRSDLDSISYLNKQLPKINGVNWKNILSTMPKGYCIVYDGKLVENYKDMLVKVYSIDELLAVIKESSDINNCNLLDDTESKLISI